MAAVTALLIPAIPAVAQTVEEIDDLLDGGYGLLIDIVVEADGTSSGTAQFVATTEAVDAIAAHFGITRQEACRRVAYHHSERSKPFTINPGLWKEQDRTLDSRGCRYRFQYPEGTHLSVFTVTPDGRIRFVERFQDPGPKTLIAFVDTTDTPWDEKVIRELIDEQDLPEDTRPLEVIRITYPHEPDGPESSNAEYQDGNTLIWVYSPLGTEFATEMRGSATPSVSESASATTSSEVVSTTVPTSATTPATIPEAPEPFPWGLLLIVMMAAFALGWVVGEVVSDRRSKPDG